MARPFGFHQATTDGCERICGIVFRILIYRLHPLPHFGMPENMRQGGRNVKINETDQNRIGGEFVTDAFAFYCGAMSRVDEG